MRKYTVTILLVVAALVTVATVGGSFGKESVPQVSSPSQKDSIITLDMLHVQESRPDQEAVKAAAPKDSIITLDILHALESGASLEEDAVPSGLSMADRIRFHDQLLSVRETTGGDFDFANMTMADRIRFHDQLLEKNP